MVDSKWITLEPDEIDFADAVAYDRQRDAVIKDRQPGNNAPTDEETALAYATLGVRCEHAGKNYLDPVKWNYLAQKIHRLPDLDNFIDVRGKFTDEHGFIVKRRDLAHWVYLGVCAEQHPHYEIFGWCWGWEAKNVPLSDPKGGRPAHFLTRYHDFIKPPVDLWRMLRNKQMLRAARRAVQSGRQFEFISGAEWDGL